MHTSGSLAAPAGTVNYDVAYKVIHHGKGGGGGGGGMRGGERVGEGGHVSHETGQLARPWGKSQQLEQIDIEEHGMDPPPLVQNKPLFH